MSFPTAERQIFSSNPLEQVICQVKFPPILRIATEPPMAFQELIREHYPEYAEKRLALSGIPIPKMLGAQLKFEFPGGNVPVAYDFTSADGRWTVGLTRDFISISTESYVRWEEFREHVGRALEALQRVYSPAYYTRVGLRYLDLIRRSRLNQEETPWSELLQPHIAPELGIPEIEPFIQGLEKKMLVRLADGSGVVRLVHGFVTDTETDEICYSIDSDFISESKTEIGNAQQVLDGLHSYAGRVFNWCITPRLRAAMAPITL